MTAAEVERWQELLDTAPGLGSPFLAPAYVSTVARVRPGVRVAVAATARGLSFLPYERRGWYAARPVGWPMSSAQAVVTDHFEDLVPLYRLTGAAGLRLVAFDHLAESQGAALTEVTGRDAAPVVDLAGGAGRYLEDLRGRSKLVAQLANLARRAEREMGELRFAVDDPDHAALEQLLAWKRLQFERTGARDLLAVPANVELLHRLRDLRDPHCTGQLSTLYAGDRLVAAHLGLRSRREFVYWFPAYDRDRGRYMPGKQLFLRLLEALGNLGVERVDLGKGEDEYKTRFKTGDAQVLSGRVTRPSLAPAVNLALSLRATTRRLAGPARTGHPAEPPVAAGGP